MIKTSGFLAYFYDYKNMSYLLLYRWLKVYNIYLKAPLTTGSLKGYLDRASG